MKKYNMTLHLSNIRDALSVSIPAASLEDALAQIHAGDGVKLEAKEESLPGRCYDVSRVYIENIHVPADKLGKIYACIFGKGDRDESSLKPPYSLMGWRWTSNVAVKRTALAGPKRFCFAMAASADAQIVGNGLRAYGKSGTTTSCTSRLLCRNPAPGSPLTLLPSLAPAWTVMHG